MTPNPARRHELGHALTDHAPTLQAPIKVSHLPSHEDAWEQVGAIIDRTFPAGGYKLLEAGGGSITALGALKDAQFTVIDISREQLDRNDYAATKIEGDLQTFGDYPQKYDVIVCRDVLEHLEEPEQAWSRLLDALAPGGLLVVAGPVPSSFKGLLTKWSPHPLHVAYYRGILGEPEAGLPGHAPFKAHMAFFTRPAVLKAAAQRAGLSCVLESLTLPSWMLQRMRMVSPLLPAVYSGAMAALRAASLGTWRPELTDMVLVFSRA
jgi:SAM-dependent methyltransferase